ncbi:MAG: ribose-phosphate diphosphokinase [Arhodomonas sp.]|nr:ribose-phosphate diphosphokinase [Arhodomonas sp.]
MRLLFLLGALRDAGAARLTAVIPYLAYARKDRRTKARDPVATRYLAQLIEASGVDRVVVMDVHNPAAYENAFRVPAVHLEAAPLFVDALAAGGLSGEAVVVSPDTGGYKRAEAFRERLDARLGGRSPMAFVEKKRSAGVVSGEAIVGEIAGRHALIVDDLVSSGGTLRRAADACRAAGAASVSAVATHGLFTGDADGVLTEAGFDRFLVADTIPPFRLSARVRERLVTVVETAPFVAEAIRRLHEGGSLVALQGAREDDQAR